VLIVLDGWGYRPKRDGNAIELGETPVWHGLWERGPRTLLEASGQAVGLPAGQMGNSEVGHLNLGAGNYSFRAHYNGNANYAPSTGDACESFSVALDQARTELAQNSVVEAGIGQ